MGSKYLDILCFQNYFKHRQVYDDCVLISNFMTIYFLYFKHDYLKKFALKFILFKNMTLFIKLDRI